jgi:hypothetical protein
MASFTEFGMLIINVTDTTLSRGSSVSIVTRVRAERTKSDYREEMGFLSLPLRSDRL